MVIKIKDNNKIYYKVFNDYSKYLKELEETLKLNETLYEIN